MLARNPCKQGSKDQINLRWCCCCLHRLFWDDTARTYNRDKSIQCRSEFVFHSLATRPPVATGPVAHLPEASTFTLSLLHGAALGIVIVAMRRCLPELSGSIFSSFCFVCCVHFNRTEWEDTTDGKGRKTHEEYTVLCVKLVFCFKQTLPKTPNNLSNKIDPFKGVRTKKKNPLVCQQNRAKETNKIPPKWAVCASARLPGGRKVACVVFTFPSKKKNDTRTACKSAGK